MRLLIFVTVVLILFGSQAWADCRSDCQKDYQSWVESCKAQYNDPDDAEDLTSCMDDAKNEYESCLQECETEANTTDVR